MAILVTGYTASGEAVDESKRVAGGKHAMTALAWNLSHCDSFFLQCMMPNTHFDFWPQKPNRAILFLNINSGNIFIYYI
jgi:hypothetical protein